MAELDIERLKGKIERAAAEHGLWNQTMLTSSEWQWVHAALEDRDRLREAAQTAFWALRAALEGHD